MTAASPFAALAAGDVLQMTARVRHSRLGRLRHAFSYRADYLLFAPETLTRPRGLLRRNGRGILALWDRDHGGPPGDGKGAAWAWARLAEAGISRSPDMVLGLLTQPRIFGFAFNPVSFWLLWQADALIAVIAEVTNTWGHRHSYLCRKPGLAPIDGSNVLSAVKQMHVSPFQDVAGGYRFRFAVSGQSADVLICHDGPRDGLVARMQGQLTPLSQARLITSLVTRPGGALRVVALIYLHALRLTLRGATWRPLPPAPNRDFSE